MQTVDVLIVTFAVIALVGSVAGSVLYEPPGQDFAINFQTMDVELDSQSGSVAAPGATGGTASVELDHGVDVDNLTRLEFEVTVNGGTPAARVQAVSFQIELVDPSGNTVDDTTVSLSSGADSNSATVSTPGDYFPAAPESREARYATIEDAREEVDADAYHTNGTGTWTVRVTATFPALNQETLNVESIGTATHYMANVQTAVDIGATA